ncbi:transcriptional regulator GcvA [Roseomonas gilardii]|uniref:transcriptional regulator GcvA n=1 Tax=Roseomonas gilardii TaxID=257708 RepID=UPI00119E0D30|nr:transcriptional regulator GcvA [Roseomonas gilardii]
MRSLPSLHALRAFEAAARLGSFKAAASELGVTHGAISQQVRLLEEWLRAPVFERHNRRVVLTAAARTYLSDISPAFDQIATATTRFGQADGTTLRVNAPATFTLRWLLPRLGSFREQHTDIKVRLETSNLPLEALPDAFDIVIRGGPDSFQDYSVRSFLSEQRLPVCSPDLMRRRPIQSLDDLRRHTFLHTLSLPRLWGDWLAKAGAVGLDPADTLTLDHFYLTLQAALDGTGIAIGPTALVARDLAEGRLVAPFSSPLLPARSYCTYVREATPINAAIHAFRSWIEIQGSLPG